VRRERRGSGQIVGQPEVIQKLRIRAASTHLEVDPEIRIGSRHVLVDTQNTKGTCANESGNYQIWDVLENGSRKLKLSA
jgi:hypothetical protein